jgi:hypothetical protein
MRSLTLSSLLIFAGLLSWAGDFADSGNLPRLGIGVKASMLLGIGVEAATSVTQKTNVRGGFNMFSYEYDYTKDNIDYGAKMRLRSAQATFDWFPFGGGFHLSPGVLLYNGNQVEANGTVAGGKSFTLGDAHYTSLGSDPVKAVGTVDLSSNSVAPMFLFGWGNLLRRRGGHFSVNFEMGAAFSGEPKAKLALTGTACQGATCYNAATDPTVQANVRSEESKVNNSISFLQATPVISVGFGYRFGGGR